MSSHKLHVETGRFKDIPRQERICRGCTTADKDIIADFLHLPACELPIEDENHCLFYCSFYSDIRTIYVVDGVQSEIASCLKNYLRTLSQLSCLINWQQLF